MAITIAARLNPEIVSRLPKAQILIIAALVTDSVHPVMKHISRQNTVYRVRFVLRLRGNIANNMGSSVRNPAKCVPDTASRCEQLVSAKVSLTSSSTSDVSPMNIAAAMSGLSNIPVTYC